MKVILAEKPSVARDIAQCLGVTQRKGGYIEGNGYQVTWEFGHLVELKEPDEYYPEWKRWSLDTLPIIPEKFQLRARGEDSARKRLVVPNDYLVFQNRNQSSQGSCFQKVCWSNDD